MGSMVYSLLWVMQDFYDQPCVGFPLLSRQNCVRISKRVLDEMFGHAVFP